jgi:LacI family transcriptional regulator
MNENNSKVKISDIAKRAGVSAGTVDRVIHNRGEVSKNTRDKVLAILNEMNYQPDILASTLASKKTFRIAALLPEAGKINLFWNAPLAGLVAASKEIMHYGIALENYFFTINDQNSFKNEIDRIIASKPDGVIITPLFTDFSKNSLEKLNTQSIPVVFMNTNIDEQNNLAFVGQDTRQSGMVAARLMDNSLNIGETITIVNFINEKAGNEHILSREKGFREYFETNTKALKRQLNTLNIYSQDQNEINAILANAIGLENPAPKTKGVFVTNSRVFRVANFLKKENLTNVILAGYDLLETNIDHLRNNHIDFLISQNPWDQGFKSIMAIFNARIMKKEIVKNQFLPIDIITKENIDYYLNN